MSFSSEPFAENDNNIPSDIPVNILSKLCTASLNDEEGLYSTDSLCFKERLIS
jgi:hypothetical protein